MGRCRRAGKDGLAGDSAEPGIGGQNEIGSSQSGGVAGDAQAGRYRTRRHDARRVIGDGSRGGRDHARRGGGVHAPGPVRRHRCAGRSGSGADARRGAGGAAGADAVPGRDRDQGVHEPGRPQRRTGPAPPAGRGRRGISGLPLGGVRDRAVPHARAGRPDGPAPVPEAGTALRSAGGRGRQHLRLPRARRGSLPRPRRRGAGAAAALACLAARHHRQLTDSGRPRHGLGELAVPGLVTLADRGAARGVAGRRRLRCGGPQAHRARRGGR